MKCPYCNNEIRSGILFCTECGKKLPVAQETTEKPSHNQQNSVATAQQASIQPGQPKRSKGMLMGIITAVLILAAIFGIYYLLNDSKGGKHKTAYTIDSDDEDDNENQKEEEFDEVDDAISGYGTIDTIVTEINSAIDIDAYDRLVSVSHQNMKMIGSINNKYPITMELVNERGELIGSYYYNKNGPGSRLSVHGALDGSSFHLYEYDDNDLNTGLFQGTYHNGTVTGTFSLPDGKTMSFELEVVN